MRTKILKLSNASEYCLFFNIAAMLELQSEYGEDWTAAIAKYDALFRAAEILSRQGELYRRRSGEEPSEMLTAAAIKESCSPADIPLIKSAVMEAVLIGFGREIADESETDIGLASLNKKKEEA